MAFCRYCGASEADAKFCASCGMATEVTGSGLSSSAASDQTTEHLVSGDNTVGAMAYFVLPAIYFLFFADAYKQNRFVRFHSFQALFYCGGLFALIWIVWNVLGFVPGVPCRCDRLADDHGVFRVLGQAHHPGLPRPTVQNSIDRRPRRETGLVVFVGLFRGDDGVRAAGRHTRVCH